MIVKDFEFKTQDEKVIPMELYLNVASIKNIERELKQVSNKLNFYNAIPLIQQGEATIAIIYIFSGSFNTLSTLALFAVWIFFVLAIYGVFVMRKKRPDLVPTYRVPLYPIVPLVGIIGGVYILVCTIVSDTLYSLIVLAITAIGYPVYMYLKKQNN